MSETLSQEFSRLVGEYNDDDAGDATKAEAWNYIADFAVEHSHEIASALAALAPQQAAPMPGVRPLPKHGEEAEKYCAARGPRWATVFKALRDYDMSNMVSEDGGPYPFVDLVSRDGDGVSIADGEFEIVCIVDEIMTALAAPEAGTSEPVAPRYWTEGTAIIEACLAKAVNADTNDAPIPLIGAEAKAWHYAQAEAYRHALEMMGVPQGYPECLATHPTPAPAPIDGEAVRAAPKCPRCLDGLGSYNCFCTGYAAPSARKEP